MNHFKHLAIAALLVLSAGSVTAKDNVDYVDPFIELPTSASATLALFAPTD